VLGTDQLVIDGSVAVQASLVKDGFAIFRSSGTLIAPTLVWSEVASALRQLRWRGELDEDEAVTTLRRFLGAPIEAYPSRDLIEDATALARRLGWAKT
jgi:predicted nucleic acid-binding protein